MISYPQNLPISMRICYISDLDHVYCIIEEDILKNKNKINRNEGVMLWIIFCYIHRLYPHFTKFGIVKILLLYL